MKDIPAFPVITDAGLNHAGMTLRDYFAARAMQALVASGCNNSEEDVAEYAYGYADAMLQAREA